MKTKNKRKAFLTYLIVVSFLVIFISSGFKSSFFTIDKGGHRTMASADLATDYKKIAAADDLDHHLSLTAEPLKIIIEDNELCLQDTIVKVSLDSMTDEEWEFYRQELEEGYQELSEIDWEAEEAEFEKQRQEMLTDVMFDKDQLIKDLALVKDEMKNINKEEILLRLEEAKLHMDTIKHDFDWEKMEQELELAREEMEITIQELHLKMQDSVHCLHETHEALQHGLHSIEEIDLEVIMENVEEALKDIDFDFDFDFDHELNINFDSIMKDAQIAIEDIDFEEIRQNIEEAMQKMEKEMQEMDEQRRERKEGK